MTKNRILFVDDDSMILQGLRRSLRPLRDRWEASFAESGPQALRMMETEPFDVVISDMMMPGMNGAELLEEVRKRFPRTVRFILSGHAERELVLKCVNSAHRFLAKPCDPDLLTSALQQATSIAFALQDPQVAAMVGQIDKLPSPPTFYLELQRRLDSPNVTMDEIGAAIAKDVSMTAQVLKLVNSAFFGLPQKLVTATEAVTYLGVDVMRALVLSLHLNGEAKLMGLPPTFLDELWLHSLRVSQGARTIAELEVGDRAIMNEASAAGMLHDTGKVVFALSFKEKVKRATELARAKKITLPEAEREIFGCTHAEVGGYLFSLWGLPAPVVRAIAQHHRPTLEPKETFNALTAVHVADVLSHEKPAHWEGAVPLTLCQEYLEMGGWTDRVTAWKDRFSMNCG